MDFPGGPEVTQVQSLVEKLRSHMVLGNYAHVLQLEKPVPCNKQPTHHKERVCMQQLSSDATK